MVKDIPSGSPDLAAFGAPSGIFHHSASSFWYEVDTKLIACMSLLLCCSRWKFLLVDWMFCMCAIIGSVSVCLLLLWWRQGSFELARSFGSLISFVHIFDFFGVVISVCDGVAGCFIFMFSCSVFVVFCCWDLMYFVVELLCSMHHLVGLSLGSFHRRLQFQVRFGYLSFWTALLIRGWHVVVPHLGLFHCWSLCCVILVRIMVSHFAVGVLVMLYESPRWSPGWRFTAGPKYGKRGLQVTRAPAVNQESW